MMYILKGIFSNVIIKLYKRVLRKRDEIQGFALHFTAFPPTIEFNKFNNTGAYLYAIGRQYWSVIVAFTVLV